MRLTRYFRQLVLCAVLPLAACGGRDPVAPEANDLAGTAEVEVLPPDESTAANTDGGGGGPLIPAALHGRWGLSPGDCTSTRGDAKGLLTITADQLRFYESVARPSPGVQTADRYVSGNFAFTGEGTSWTRYQTLELRNGTLVRTENEPTQRHTYVRCD
jgi:hypothetical protein